MRCQRKDDSRYCRVYWRASSHTYSYIRMYVCLYFYIKYLWHWTNALLYAKESSAAFTTTVAATLLVLPPTVLTKLFAALIEQPKVGKYLQHVCRQTTRSTNLEIGSTHQSNAACMYEGTTQTSVICFTFTENIPQCVPFLPTSSGWF